MTGNGSAPTTTAAAANGGSGSGGGRGGERGSLHGSGPASSSGEGFTAEDRELLSEMGHDLLRKMDGTPFFAANPARSVPAFEKAELGFGRQLGEGSFCSAREIIAIALKQPPPPKSDGEESAPSSDSQLAAPAAGGEYRSAIDREQHDCHYDMTPDETRQFMEVHCYRGSDARYAVKRLKPNLAEEDRLKGIIDLAVECKFLAVLNHPNIVKMRGMAAGDPMTEGFFLVLDRLYDTLAERAERWKEQRVLARSSKRGCLCFGGGKVDNQREAELLQERVTVAYDISSVFRHLHGHKLIYRDIKPDNIGFDVRNDIKVFDFGLCKELSPSERTDDGLYKMSGLTGCLDFMAPEVALSKPYNLSADAYSFGILLWEIMSLEVPFAELKQEQLVEKVHRGGYRPPVDPEWPIQVRELIKELWSDDLRQRPDFDQIASLLKATLMTECAHGGVADRTEHMKDRSDHSFRVKHQVLGR